MPTDDGYLSVNEAARALPGRPHRNNVYRWCTEGTVVRGERVKLQSQRIGGRLFTRAEWVDAFIATLNREEVKVPPPSRERRRTRAEQKQHDLRVNRELQELGLI